MSALFCGLAPALQSTRVDLSRGLRTAEGDDPSRSRRSLWGRNALVVAQIAMSVMLLAAASVMYRGFHRSLREGLDFARDASNHVLMVKFDPRLVQYDDARTNRFYELLIERMRREPGVWSVGQTRNPPLGLEGFDQLAFVPEGFTMPRDRQALTTRMDSVDEGFFETMGVPIVSGRGLRPSDTAAAPRVAIVNEFFAKHYWPKGDAIGRHIRLDGPAGDPVEVVGIARTIKYGEGSQYQVDFVYLPAAQHPVARRVLLLRTAAGDPLSLVPRVKEVVRSLDPNMPILRLMSYGELYRYEAVAGPGVAIKLVATLGTVALILAIAGLYGLVAYNVGRRTREIGIRMAIGARPRDVRRLMMRKGLALVAIGLVFGVAMGLGVEKVMNAMLFEAAGVDLLVYAVVVPAMIAVTMLAAYVPARRAARIAPTLALRYE
jgi:predicted permease